MRILKVVFSTWSKAASAKGVPPKVVAKAAGAGVQRRKEVVSVKKQGVGEEKKGGKGKAESKLVVGKGKASVSRSLREWVRVELNGRSSAEVCRGARCRGS